MRNPLREQETHRGMRVIAFDEYETWTECVDRVERPRSEFGLSDIVCSSRRGSEWNGGGFQQVMKMARQGWPEGRAKMDEMAKRIDAAIAGRITRERYEEGMTGPMVDVQAAIIGLPEQFWTIEDEQAEQLGKSGPYVHLVLNVSASSTHDAKSLERRGATIGALALALERAGRAVAITVCDTLQSSGVHAEVRVKVKKAQDYMDPDLMAFTLGHPSVLRVIFFGIEETWPADIRAACGVPGSYGMVDTLMPIEGDVVIDSAEIDRMNSDAEAEAWILRKLASFGVRIADA